ncbi:A disintegrin and metalloproteinase with thrombospondin motifs 2 [Python bivittatus]|uniref:A disintegrin and metalloproteinase with thrombospondin motifs 2 n=1 Tax=Python bivittatus TaxID=176946 RepID=A0A9F2QX66_PYTBI|nr:A disintegrin and metalloproteinase with thrombospondin motifs 2 [Python bivittatus]
MAPLAGIALLLACWVLLLAPGAPQSPGERDYILGDLEEYRLVTPTSTDSKGRFVSNVVSGASKRRCPRDTRDLPHEAAGKEIFYNVTVFGQEFHFRLRPNSRLVAPGATMEWQEDSNITYTEPLHGDCLYVGHITDFPNASVAISNCEGLIPKRYLRKTKGLAAFPDSNLPKNAWYSSNGSAVSTSRIAEVTELQGTLCQFNDNQGLQPLINLQKESGVWLLLP